MSLEGEGKCFHVFFEYFAGEKLLNVIILHSCNKLFNGQRYMQTCFERSVQVEGGHLDFVLQPQVINSYY